MKEKCEDNIMYINGATLGAIVRDIEEKEKIVLNDLSGFLNSIYKLKLNTNEVL